MFLIVSGGDAPGKAFLREMAEKAGMIIAADKGAEYCLESGIRPDLVIGDMDSLSGEAYQQIKQSGIPLKEHNPLKDETDTQLALEEAMRHGPQRIEILAATGSRIDHSIANIHLLYAAHASGIDACIVSEKGRIFLADSRSRLTGMKGAVVSLLPLTMEVEGISLTGFQWSIQDADMKMGRPYGISNVIVSDEALIEVRTGILIVVLFNP